MNNRMLLILSGIMLLGEYTNGQTVKEKSGIIKIDKPDTMVVETTRLPSYNFMMNGCHFRIIYPDNYLPAVYPAITYDKGLVMMDIKRNRTSDKIVQFDYSIYTDDTIPSSKGTLTYLIDLFPRMHVIGSSLLISHLSFKDKNGKLHVDEIPEIKIVRID